MKITQLEGIAVFLGKDFLALARGLCYNSQRG